MSTETLRAELATAKADAVRKVHKLERVIDVTKQRDDAVARKAIREAEIVAEDERIAALDAQLAELAT